MEPPYTLIDGCRTCGLDRQFLPEVFAFDHPVPLAGAFTGSRDEAIASPRYPLTWLYCPVCTNVSVAEDIPDTVLYSQYNYQSSTVLPLVGHFRRLAWAIEGYFRARRDDASMRVLEIGCNDGVLLRNLPQHWELWGCDPSDVARDAMQYTATNKYNLINEPVERSGHPALLEPFDLVVASNTLAHMSDLMTVLSRIAFLVKPSGELWVEVHDLDATLETGQWDTIYHEHKVEWSLQSLQIVMEKFGLTMHSYEKHRLHGGLIRAMFHHDNMAEKRVVARPSFMWLDTMYGMRYDMDPGFLLRRAPKPTFAYGAAGRATMWFNNMDEIEIQFVLDDSLARIDKYVPGVGLKILAAERMTMPMAEDSRCIITAWNYADEIIKSHPEYRGLWLRSFN